MKDFVAHRALLEPLAAWGYDVQVLLIIADVCTVLHHYVHTYQKAVPLQS